MASGTLVSRILGLIRTALLTAVVGTSLAADAFGYANTLPDFIFNLLSAGVLNAVLIPQITKAMKNKDGGEDFVNRLITVSLTLILGVAVLATALSPVLVKGLSGLTGPAERLAILFAFICMPQIAFYGLYAVLGNVLNTRGRFAAYMWTPALANIVQIIGQVIFLIIWGQQRDPSLWTPAMILILAGSTTLGIVIQGLGLIPEVKASGFKYRPKWGLQGMGSVSRMTLWTLAGLLIQQAGGLFNSWVMNSVRNQPGNELVASVATHRNAFLVFMLPHSLVTVSILTALFPSLSRAWQSTKLREIRTILTKGLQIPAVAVIPLSLMIIALSKPLVKVIFVGLDGREAADLAIVLSIMCLGTLGFGVATWQQRYCFASENGRAYFWLQAILTTIQIIFAVLALSLVPGKLAVASIAAGQTIGNWIVAFIFMLMVQRELNGINLPSTLRLWVRLAVASLPGTGISWLVGTWIFRILPTWIGAVTACAIGAIIFLVAFLACAKTLRIGEVQDMLHPITKRLKKLKK